MFRPIAILLLAGSAAWAQNLLANPGFENLDGQLPADWKFYVEPREGASAVVDDTPFEGAHCVRLAIPTPYARDPANNWSQNLLQPLSGKQLVVHGMIKTQDAGEAALWIQAFQKSPLKVLLEQSSSIRQPVKATRDWTSVEVSAVVPAHTDFVVIRCVLRGHGTAWFDNLSAVANDTVTPPTSPELKMPIPPVAPKSPNLQAETPNAPTSKSLTDAYNALRAANAALRQSNSALTNQVSDLRRELDDLRAQVEAISKEAQSLREETKPASRSGGSATSPPLIPRSETDALP